MLNNRCKHCNVWKLFQNILYELLFSSAYRLVINLTSLEFFPRYIVFKLHRTYLVHDDYWVLLLQFLLNVFFHVLPTS